MPELPVYRPMLASGWAEPFSDPDWAFEVKWDGVRAVATWDGVRLIVRSRTGRDVTSGYPELDELRRSEPCIIDGEIVAFDPSGRPSFGLLQQRAALRRAGGGPEVRFVAFDLLYQGEPLIGRPWQARRRLLEGLSLPAPFVVPEPVIGDGAALWGGIVEHQLEGMVAKRVASQYRPGARSGDWRKIARIQHVRAVVGGFVPGEGGRAHTFGSLLLGLVDGSALRYIGSVGTGFDDGALREIRRALDDMTTERSPFAAGEDVPPAAAFVEPGLVAVVAFKEWTRAGKLRAPSFKGFAQEPWTAVTWRDEGPPAPKTESG